MRKGGSLDTPLAEDGSLTLSDTIQGDSDPENEAIENIHGRKPL